jgi:hypothetical protein
MAIAAASAMVGPSSVKLDGPAVIASSTTSPSSSSESIDVLMVPLKNREYSPRLATSRPERTAADIDGLAGVVEVKVAGAMREGAGEPSAGDGEMELGRESEAAVDAKMLYHQCSFSSNFELLCRGVTSDLLIPKWNSLVPIFANPRERVLLHCGNMSRCMAILEG